jgi:prepilin-type N-terminal cleavage/methylation domain-containing protein
MNQRWAPGKKGFTIVELLIAITVIAILVTIGVVGYSNVRTSTAVRSVQSDLLNAFDSIESDAALNGGLVYPDADNLLDGIRLSPNVTLTPIVSTLPHYSNLSSVQAGVLVSEICQNLIDEEYGNGVNAGGNIDDYIMGCGNWNDDSMQITGWDTQLFNVPVSSTAFTDYADSVPAGSAYHPNQRSTIQTFYRELNSRFLAQGGTYPITSFWDAWASPTNGGVMMEPLPEPDPVSDETRYCIEGRYEGIDLVWHVRSSGKLSEGTC